MTTLQLPHIPTISDAGKPPHPPSKPKTPILKPKQPRPVSTIQQRRKTIAHTHRFPIMFSGEREQDRGGGGWGHVSIFKNGSVGVVESGGGGGGETGTFGVFAAAAADGDVSEGAAVGPVAAAGLAEVTGLGEVVVVVVAEFGVGGVAAGAGEVFGLIGWWTSGGGAAVVGGVGWHCGSGLLLVLEGE
ncbi:hypothetical protein Hanom_Chr09g00863821 [Helianthus anomalus]